jgi:rhodanese-related sulfurtransferase
MDSTTEAKAALQRTQQNMKKVAGEAKANLSETAEKTSESLSQAAQSTKEAVDQGIEGAQQQVETAWQDSKTAMKETRAALQEGINDPKSLIDRDVKAEAAEVKGNIESVMGKARDQVQTSIAQAKAAPQETIKGITRQMATTEGSDRVTAADLKRRLDWGEPAFTIIDVRHRESFNQERIQGAISMPEADLVSNASNSLENEREIFVYGETELQAEQSLLSLKEAGFSKVAYIRNGMSGWKNAGGATEGIAA